MHAMKYFYRFTLPVISLAVMILCMAGCQSQDKAKEAELEATIRRVIDETWNKGNFDAFDELYDKDFVRHRPPFPDVIGLEAHKERFGIVFSAFPDHVGTIHAIIINGDKAAVQYTWRGTHTGEGLSIPPTNKEVTVAGCDVYKIVDGKVVEEWDHEGFLSLFQQLGYKIVPPE